MIRLLLLIGLIFSCVAINAQISYDSLDNNVKRMATKNRNSAASALNSITPTHHMLNRSILSTGMKG